MENEISEVEQFYRDVSDLLGIQSNYEFNPYTLGGKYRTRWNNREPGNGRFEGYGLIRFFGPSCIHVSITKPVHINKTFESKVDVLKALSQALDESTSGLKNV